MTNGASDGNFSGMKQRSAYDSTLIMKGEEVATPNQNSLNTYEQRIGLNIKLLREAVEMLTDHLSPILTPEMDEAFSEGVEQIDRPQHPRSYFNLKFGEHAEAIVVLARAIHELNQRVEI